MDELDLGSTIKGFGPGQKVFGRYALVRLLGRGGMGVVWLAKDEELVREAALKFLPEVVAADPASINDLKREVRRAIDLAHPHIIKTHDFITDGRTAGVSMEYLSGGTLATRRLEEPGQIFAPDTIGPWINQLCQALHYAHETGEIVHRDLKPTNLMLDAKDRLKVVDFGIAASISDSVSRVSKQAGSSGTPVYMSPQQMMGEDPAVTDDIYAVGATVFELLTGKPPFHAGNIMLQVQNKAAPLVNERRKTLNLEPVPSDWEETIAACLAKEATARPQSAMEIAERLGLTESRGRNTLGTSRKPEQNALPAEAKESQNRPAATTPARPQSAEPGSTSKTGLYVGLATAVLLLGGLGWYFGLHLPEQRRLVEAARLETARLEAVRLEAVRLANARGGLIVRTTPAGAELRVGAVALEKSPLTLKDQRLGRYPVVARLDDYEDWTGEVEVKENQFAELNITLVRSTGTLNFSSDASDAEAEVTVGPPGFQPQSLAAGKSLDLLTGRYRAIVRRNGWSDREQTFEVRRKVAANMAVNYGTAGRAANWLFSAGLAELQSAARSGQHAALIQIGDRYHLGIGTANHVTARQWYQKALAAGSPQAEGRLGRSALTPEEESDFLLRAAAKGDPIGIVALAQRGKRLKIQQPPDEAQLAQAVAALEAAANAGDPMAIHDLAGCYLTGQGVTLSRERAHQLYLTLAEMGSADGMAHVGQALLAGTGVAKDQTAGVSWLKRAAELRDEAGMIALAGLYRSGQSSTLVKDINKALEWYLRAAQAGNTNAMFTIADIRQQGTEAPKDFAAALKWFQAAAEQGHVTAMDRLGRMYHRGEGTSTNYAEAAKWFRRAADLNHANSIAWLGSMAHRGEGQAVNYSEALALYRRAQSLGVKWVTVQLGIMHQGGLGVSQDYAEAMRLFKMAAEDGSAEAMNWIGSMHYHGQGVAVNMDEAARWFRRSAEAGNFNSMDWMGLLYSEGKGVPQDMNQAIEWWRKAAREGVKNAQKSLTSRGLTW